MHCAEDVILSFKRIVGPDPKCSGKVKGDVDTKRCGTVKNKKDHRNILYIQLFESRTCPGLSFVALGEPHWESGINSGTPKTFTNMGSGRKGT